ncbi:3-dehydroquinate synthase [Candidatus Formimonas warabiya]|uniref:3-dehydroquinate synthase n=1 Tax=Formimonas warabiya TaxID=1761012 RepID=A0A3G1KPF0_FORW1|nr:3-dehydroquinate synthase [Candidatus Formimonas warabiya]ATW24005.1 3-dehydroquinate synthase [Candidatus Formimonas warabiya]
MKKVKVSLTTRSYCILVGSGTLNSLAEELAKLGLKGKVLMVTNTTVEPLYGKILIDELTSSGYAVSSLVLPDGENFKSLETTAQIYDAILEAGLDRQGIILALGGGVIGDMAGFAAATYMRGINFVQVPTTLLAQVDASVGGKVAVNHPRGKNLIGSFYQPSLVFIDTATLDTLPVREILSGLSEVIKYGIITDPELFSYLEVNVIARGIRGKEFFIDIVEKSCAIKAKVVSRDEREENVRAILNFGHTIGHGIEAATHYQVFRHGEAVAIGMMGAACISREMGLISAPEVERIRSLIISVGLPVYFSGIAWEEIWYHMQADKKAKDGNINFILPTSIGSVVISPVDPHTIRKVVESELIR